MMRTTDCRPLANHPRVAQARTREMGRHTAGPLDDARATPLVCGRPPA